MEVRHEHSETGGIQLPAPTAWPLVLAVGLVLGSAGLVTNMGISHAWRPAHDLWMRRLVPPGVAA